MCLGMEKLSLKTGAIGLLLALLSGSPEAHKAFLAAKLQPCCRVGSPLRIRPTQASILEEAP